MRDKLAMMSARPWEPRLARLEGSYEQIDRRLGDLTAHMDARFGQVDARFSQVDARFSQVDARFGALERKVDTLQWRLTALVVGTWATTILTILFHH